jgi:hypothetical protein
MTDIAIHLAIVIGIVAVTTTLVLEEFRLSPFFVTTMQLGLVLTGFVILDLEGHSATAIPYIMGTVAMVFGYHLYNLANRSRKPLPQQGISAETTQHLSSLIGFMILVSLLTVYHFFVVGIPLLAADPEVARFNFADSGLLGIPGRMYLFGIPFLLLLSTCVATRFPSPRARRVERIAWIVYICVNLFSAFKGALLEALMMLLLTTSLRGKPVHLVRVIWGTRLLLLVGAVLYGSFLTMSYFTLGFTNTTDIVAYASERVTIGSAEPGYAVMQDFGTGNGEYLLGDFRYFLSKYFHFLGVLPSPVLPLDLSVSAQLYDTPISDDNLIVPVTVGIFPELYANFNTDWAILMMLGVGLVYAMVYKRALIAKNPFAATVMAFGIYMLQRCIVKGGVAYFLLNYLLMSGFLAGLYIVCGFLAHVTTNASGASWRLLHSAGDRGQ